MCYNHANSACGHNSGRHGVIVQTKPNEALMPTVWRQGGHRFFFFSNEGNEPPHIHVETGEDYAKFWLNPVALAKSAGYNAKELRELREVVQENRDLFAEKWHEYFGS